jgi:hypothetical protein
MEKHFMTLERALDILIRVHIDDDEQTGFRILVGATPHDRYFVSVDDYAEAWQIVREHKGETLWRPIISAPKDGTHIFACDASTPYGQHWTFEQRPPTVVHWFEDGFYTSVNEHEPVHPFAATHWQPLPIPPTTI